METVKDFFQSIFDSYKDRVKSPLIGSFIITFLIFNWRSIAILFFSEWPIHCRIEWIDEKYHIYENFLYPFLISLFYVLLLPYINIAFEIFLTRYTNHRNEKARKSYTDSLEHKKEDAKILRQIADAEAGTSEINDLKERNEALAIENKNIITQNQQDLTRHNSIVEQFKSNELELNNQIKELQAQIENDSVYNEPYILEIFNNFTDSQKNEFVSFCDLLQMDRFHAASIHPNIDTYIKMNLVTNIESGGKIGNLKLSKSGQRLYKLLKVWK